MWFSGFFFLILSLIVEVYLWWKLQDSLIFLNGRTCTIGGWLNTFLPHCMFLTCSCLLDSWKKKCQVPITSVSLHWAIYWHKPVYIFTHRAAHFFWTCKMYIYYVLLHLFASHTHILYFDAAKFSIKQLSMILSDFVFLYLCLLTLIWFFLFPIISWLVFVCVLIVSQVFPVMSPFI